MNKNQNTVEMVELDENFSFNAGAKRVPDETRIPVMITSVTLVGNEAFKDKSGKDTVSYKIGIGFTSNTAHVGEDGEAVEGFHEFYAKYTATLNAKGGLLLSGLPEACNVKTAADLKQLVNGLIGKQISALTKYRPYKNKQGENKTAVDLEKFKVLSSSEDFTAVESGVHVPYFSSKYNKDKKIVTIVNGKASVDLVSAHIKTDDAGVVDIDDIV